MDISIGNTRRYQLSYKTLSTLATCYFETAQLLYHCQNTSARITYHFELSDATSNKYNINVQKQVINSMKHRHGHWLLARYGYDTMTRKFLKD